MVKFKTWIVTKSRTAWTVWTVVVTVLANLFLIAHPASLPRLLFRGCFCNRWNKVTLSKPYEMLLSRNLHVSTSFKDKGCNHFALKSQEWFLTTILLIHNKAVEHRQLHKVDGQLLTPLQCFVRYLIGFDQLVSAVDSTHVLVRFVWRWCRCLLSGLCTNEWAWIVLSIYTSFLSLNFSANS